MVLKIEGDHSRFRQIVRGAIKKELRKYMSRGELLGIKGRDVVSIPLPQIELPSFRFAPKSTGGVGQGDGDAGTPIAMDPPDGHGEPGDQPGRHLREVDFTIDELARMMGEELELPRIEPKGRNNILVDGARYTGISRAGPDSLRHFRRTYKAALKRQLASGTYEIERPAVVPIRDDSRYRARRTVPLPQTNAVIMYMMDVSGSMGETQKEIVRLASFWIDAWLHSQYRGVECRYIVHDAAAREVDRDTFFHLRESGGTRISSAYAVAADLIDQRFPPAEWNVYLFHFTDGDNSRDDDEEALRALTERLLPAANLFGYGEVKGTYGLGSFHEVIEEHCGRDERVAVSIIDSRDDIYDSIKAFLGTGR